MVKGNQIFSPYLALLSAFAHRWHGLDLIFSYHLMPRHDEKDENVCLVIQTHVSRVAPVWDLWGTFEGPSTDWATASRPFVSQLDKLDKTHVIRSNRSGQQTHRRWPPSSSCRWWPRSRLWPRRRWTLPSRRRSGEGRSCGSAQPPCPCASGRSGCWLRKNRVLKTQPEFHVWNATFGPIAAVKVGISQPKG